MNIRTKLLIAAILTIALPLSVTIVTWLGLLRMGEEIGIVAEEYGEARTLQPIEGHLTAAILALQQEDDRLRRQALQHLKEAEATLLTYLAGQYESDANEEHQADESHHAYQALMAIRSLAGGEWEALSIADKLERTRSIREGVRRLYSDADSGVIAAQRLARGIQKRTLRLVLTISLASALACIALSVWSTRSVIRRLRELHKTVVTRAEGAARPKPKDISVAMNQIDEMSERMFLRIEEKNRELLRKERMAGIGLLAADVAHEINNPMNAMLGLSELSLRALGRGPMDDDTKGELHESLTVIRREALRCREIVERLMAMVRSRGEPHWFDATRLLVETVDVAKASRPDKAACFHVLRSEHPLRVFAPSQEVRQIILTLMINAADAVSDDGRIEVDATQSDRETWLRVRDNGRGFTPEMQADFPVAFRTDRAEEGGIGLGLSIASSLSMDIGAELRSFSDGPGKGSLFLLAIPTTASE